VLDPDLLNDETIFKGLLVSSLISAFNYKFYIFRMLEMAGYDKDVTLSRFHELSKNSNILLNFNCVNTTQQRFSVINRYTRPNMPLWAALMAAASLPYL
jgi:predicted acylesterase/phospholipase RssA